MTGSRRDGRELDSVLGRHGITKIEAMGQPLDPNKHQAMIEMPSDQEPGTIVQEMQSGYMIKDRLCCAPRWSRWPRSRTDLGFLNV